jgi:hypothetical protein
MNARIDIYWLLEQPSNSWMFKLPMFISITKAHKLFKVCTWMGLFGHCMQKYTHLLTNMECFAWLPDCL